MSFAEEAAPMLMTSYAAPLSAEDDTSTPADTVYVGETELSDGEWTADGLTDSTGTLPASGYAYYKDGVLTLNNFEYEGEGFCYEKRYYVEDFEYYQYNALIYSDAALSIALEGDNSLCAKSPYFYEENNGFYNSYYTKGIVTNFLEISGSTNSSLSLNASDGISAYNGIVISNSTVAVTAYDGIYSKNDVTITNSTVNIDSYYEGIFVSKGNLTISNSTVDIVSDFYSGIETSKSNVSISDSTINILSYGEGIFISMGSLNIFDSTVDIVSNFYYGIETYRSTVSIAGSTVKLVSNEKDGIYVKYGTVSITGSTVNLDSCYGAGIYVYNYNSDSNYIGDLAITNSTVTIVSENNGIYAYGKVNITDSTVTINSNCHGIYTTSRYSQPLPVNETVLTAPDIIITRSNITIDAAYYTLRSETGITLIECELPEDMEIVIVDDEYVDDEDEDSSDSIPVMLSLTSEIADESNAGESTEEFENPIYTVVDADGQAVHHLIITYNKPADDPTDPETEDTVSPIPNLNLTGIRLTENGKTKTLPSAIGSRRTLTFTPAEGYYVADVLVNGKSVGAVEKYTVVTVPSITVEVIYEEIEG